MEYLGKRPVWKKVESAGKPEQHFGSGVLSIELKEEIQSLGGGEKL